MLYNDLVLSSLFIALKEHKHISPIVVTLINNKWELNERPLWFLTEDRCAGHPHWLWDKVHWLVSVPICIAES